MPALFCSGVSWAISVRKESSTSHMNITFNQMPELHKHSQGCSYQQGQRPEGGSGVQVQAVIGIGPGAEQGPLISHQESEDGCGVGAVGYTVVNNVLCLWWS